MKRTATALILIMALFLSAVAGILFLQTTMEKTITVPDDYPTINAAVHNAANGDTIYLKKGTYANPENQTFLINKTLSIIGEDAATTIINGPGFSKSFIPNTAFQISTNNF